MGQVPVKILLVGDGRLAKTLASLFPEALRWSRSAGASLSSFIQQSDPSHIWLAISDTAIPEVISAHPGDLENRTVVHFSGSLSKIGNAFSAHPLSTFSGASMSKTEFDAIPFTLDLDGPELSALIPGSKNPAHRIAAEDRAYYHALCTISGNFTVLLWESVARRFQDELGLPATMLDRYREQIFKNLAIANGSSVLTGPLARGDKSTIEAHRQALTAHADDSLLKIYDGFSDLYRNDKSRKLKEPT